MIETYAQFQNYTMAFCIWGLLLILGLAALVYSGVIKDIVEKWLGMGSMARIMSVCAVVLIVLQGATKGVNLFSFKDGLKDGTTASVATNDEVRIYWQRDTSKGIIVPESATVYIDYMMNGTSNWVNLAETTVGAWSWSGSVANATNYYYSIWAYYIPPEPVHTNSVWIYKTLKDRNDRYALPLRAIIRVNGKAISTPKEVRDEE